MMKTILMSSVFVMLFGGNIAAQNPKSLSLSSEFSTFVVAGFEPMDTAMGDLNGDGRADCLLALRKINEVELSTPDNLEKSGEQPRPLLILLRQADGTWKLGARNDAAVDCYVCGGTMGDPYQRMAIKNGYFTVETSGGSRWMWSRYLTFKFVKAENRWVFHRMDESSFDRANPNAAKEKKSSRKARGKKKIYFENYAESQLE